MAKVDQSESDASGAAETWISVDGGVENTVRSRQVADDPGSGRHTYYRGVFFATVALRVRSALPRRGAAFREVDCYQQRGKEYRGAISETKEDS